MIVEAYECPRKIKVYSISHRTRNQMQKCSDTGLIWPNNSYRVAQHYSVNFLTHETEVEHEDISFQ